MYDILIFFLWIRIFDNLNMSECKIGTKGILSYGNFYIIQMWGFRCPGIKILDFNFFLKR